MEEEKKNVSEQMKSDAKEAWLTAEKRKDNWEDSQIKKGSDGKITVEKKENVLSEQATLIQEAGLFGGIRGVLESTFDREHTEAFKNISNQSIDASFEALQQDINKYLYAIDYANDTSFDEILARLNSIMGSDKFSPDAREEVLGILRKQRALKLGDRNAVGAAKAKAKEKYQPKIEAVKKFGKNLGGLVRATDEEVDKAIEEQKQLSEDIVKDLKDKRKEFKEDLRNLKRGDLSDTAIDSQKDLNKKIEEQENKVRNLTQQHRGKEASLKNVEVAKGIVDSFQRDVDFKNIDSFILGKTRAEKSSPKKYIKDVKEEFENTLDRTKKYLEKRISESNGEKSQAYQSVLDSLQTKAEEFSALLTSAGSVKTKQQAQLAVSFQDRFKDTFAPVLDGVRSEAIQLLGVADASLGTDFFRDAPTLIENKKNELENERKRIDDEYVSAQEDLAKLGYSLIDNQQTVGRIEESRGTIKPSIKEEKGAVGKLKDELEQWATIGATPFTLLRNLAKESFRINDFRVYDDERKLAIELLKEEGIENPTEKDVDERSKEIELVRQLGGVELKKQPKATPLVSAPSGPDDPRKVDGEVYTLMVTKDTYKKMVVLIDGFISEYPGENKPKEKELVAKLNYVATALNEIEEIIADTSATIDGFAQGDEAAKETENILQDQIENIAGAKIYSTIFGHTFSTSKRNLSQIKDLYGKAYTNKETKFNDKLTAELVNVKDQEKVNAKAFFEQDKTSTREDRTDFVNEQTARIIKNVVIRNVAEMTGAFRTPKGTGGVFESVLNNVYVEKELQADYKRVLEHPSLFALKYKNGIQSALKYKEEIEQLTTIYENIDEQVSFLDAQKKLEESETRTNTIKEYESEISTLKDSVALIYGDIYLREANKTLSNMRADTKVADVKELIALKPKRQTELAPHILSALMFGEYSELRDTYFLSDESIKLWSEKFPALYVKDGAEYTFINKEGKPKHIEGGEPIDRTEIAKLAEAGKFRQIYSIYTTKLKLWESANRTNQYGPGIATEASDMYVKTFGETGPEYKKLPKGTAKNMDRDNIYQAAFEAELQEYYRELAAIRSRATVYTLFKNAMIAHEMEDSIEAVFKGFTPAVKTSIMSKMSGELKGDTTSLDELKIGSLNKEQIEALKSSVQASFGEQKAVVTNKPGQKSYENISNSLTTMLDNLAETLDSNSKIILTEKTGLLKRKATESEVNNLDENNPEKITTEQILMTLDKMAGEGFKHDDKELKKQGLKSKDVEKLKTADEMNRVRMFINNVRGITPTATQEEAVTAAREAAAAERPATVDGNEPVVTEAASREQAEEAETPTSEETAEAKKKKEIAVGGKAVYGKATDEAKKLAAALLAYAKSREKYYADKESAVAESSAGLGESASDAAIITEASTDPVVADDATSEQVLGGLIIAEMAELSQKDDVKTYLANRSETGEKSNDVKEYLDGEKDVFWTSLLHSSKHMLGMCEDPAALEGSGMSNEDLQYLKDNKESIKNIVTQLESCVRIDGQDDAKIAEVKEGRKKFMQDIKPNETPKDNIGHDMLAWAGAKTEELSEFMKTLYGEIASTVSDTEIVASYGEMSLAEFYTHEGTFTGTKEQMVKAMMQNLQKMNATVYSTAAATMPGATGDVVTSESPPVAGR